MDLITTAISAAIPFVAEKMGGLVISDSYAELKSWFKQKLGDTHTVVTALERVEERPSEKRLQLLHDAVIASGLDRDTEAIRLATNLANLPRDQGGVTIKQVHNEKCTKVKNAKNSTFINEQHNHR
ncbi:hypothetical protein SIID45300_02280 [Candidatus Magnetaquicoccaceae bacterium FCR-1]|uniref:Uncharacterized protein n=1 Tax=Candidatus Magnetaquiglobus chichijimensis TaxID=3141448 RepID=A0ABQ0CAM7_9PROT